MEELEFYDVKTKNKFKTSSYRLEEREKEGKTGKVSVRRFAVAQSLVGDHECYRVVSKDFYEANK
jgi:hypothetical protein